jgi:NAD(P)-dependent dehydrogenase (short-subunit alcohol dehydrogenase family)
MSEPSPSQSPISDWQVDRLDDLTGRTYLITGGNSGVGYEAAAHLHRANADVIIAARSVEKGEQAAKNLARLPGTGAVELLQLDLASLESIGHANSDIRKYTDGLDAVVNNAGIMQTPQAETVDGFELQFGTNHLGHFMLNYLTFDLVEARSGRIVPVSSIVHHQADGINFADPMLVHDYSPTLAYRQSKIANLMYGIELARRLDAAGSEVMSVSAHPGYSHTNLLTTGPTGLQRVLYQLTSPFLAQKAADGAVPEVLAAAGKEARNGAYYGPTERGETRGPVGDSNISDVAMDEESGLRLWSLSEELLSISWDVA